ncbi:MAG TPA: sigma-70 family RNA polymerase sigma factor [Thermoanaerobaculia bacterium]|nr:sigma-70 family RNA polymerase sigma factor [Thermoanaerobaculia bacterium]
MHPREFLEANLAVVERAIAAVCAHASLYGADAEDFGSAAKLALLEDDCAVLRKWEGRSSFATYVTIVFRRLLIDQQRAAGRWYASAAARRQGEAAVLLERLIRRDRKGLDEALAIVRREHPEVSPGQLAALAAELPERAPRLRLVAIAEGDEERFAATDAADERVAELDRSRRSQEASEVVQAALRAMSPEDRVILRLRFAEQAAIAEIARTLGIDQRPLYRRVVALLATLRRALESAGLDAAAIGDLIGTAGERLDFQLRRKSGPFHPSVEGERSEGQP